MKRKIVILVLTGLLVVCGTGFSWGVGAAFGIQPIGGLPSQAMLSFELPRLPIVWGLGLQIGTSQFNMGLTADWWLINRPLVSFLHIYLGPGLYASLPSNFELGARLPIGIDAYPFDFFELFVEIAPALVVISNGITIPNFRVQGAAGFRFWFR